MSWVRLNKSKLHEQEKSMFSKHNNMITNNVKECKSLTCPNIYVDMKYPHHKINQNKVRC